MVGRSLAHYKILEKIGSGGMGDVYLAEDTKLDRRVALKVLPPDLAGDKQRFEQFAREAKVIAALDHPNIVTLYSVELQDGLNFLTMEFVEGRTLRDVIPADGMPLEQFFEVAIPLVDAVAAAHKKEVTHCDLKPENIMVTNDGKVKVLDFGLAKRQTTAVIAEDDSNSPTRVRTIEGTIAGTVAYMSPEQAEGKRVDARADIFSLGVILYEMITGSTPFQGDSALGVLSSILKTFPTPLSRLRPATPSALNAAVEKCLAKAPSDRYSRALDLEAVLKSARDQSKSNDSVTGPSTSASIAVGRRKLSCTLSLAIGVTTASLILLLLVRPRVATEGSVDPQVAWADRITDAQQLISEKLYGDARELLDGMLRESPEDVDAQRFRDEVQEIEEEIEVRLVRARELLDTGNLDEARTELAALTKLAPWNADVAQAQLALERRYRDESTATIPAASRAAATEVRPQLEADLRQAETAWLRAKGEPNPEGLEQQPLYQRALAEEQLANRLESSGDLAGAKQSFEAARNFLESARRDVAEAPPTTSEPRSSTTSLSTPQEESAIRQVLADYERALELEDVGLFRQVKPSITTDEQERLQASFDAVDSMDVELEVQTIIVRENTATVVTSRRDGFVVRGRSQEGELRSQTFEMEKLGTRWVIASIR